MAIRSDARLGDIPHFDVTTIDGRRIRYGEIWQRRNLLLVLVHPRDRTPAAEYAAGIEAHRTQLEEAEATVVVTADAVPGLTAPRVVVADRWGEILHTECAEDMSRFPSVEELVSWARFVRMQCPECPP